jgi:hypothetical protein
MNYTRYDLGQQRAGAIVTRPVVQARMVEDFALWREQPKSMRTANRCGLVSGGRKSLWHCR